MHCVSLSLEGIQIFHIDGIQITEQHHQNGQADRRFRSGHGQNEEDEDLSCCVTQIMRESNEIDVHRQQHQLDCHQQHDNVLTVEKNTYDRDREQNCAKDQVMRERKCHDCGRSLSLRFCGLRIAAIV